MSTTQLARSASRGSDFELSYASPIILKAKGADSRSIERHNSKKNRPVSIHDEEGKLGHDGRKRRSRGSSDDEGKLTHDGFCNEDLRVGGPYLCSVPLTSIGVPNSNPLSSVLLRKSSKGETLGTRIARIIENRKIRLFSSWPRGDRWGITLRQSKYNPERERVPTIVIIATRQNIDDTWLHTVREIHALLCEEKLSHVSVEIHDPQALKPPHTSPVQPYEKIYPKWDAVLAKILKSIDLRDILTIGCYRRGRSSNTSKNPATVLIMVDVNSRKHWRATRDAVTQILNEFSLPMVAVEFVKDRIVLLGHKEEGFNEKIMNENRDRKHIAIPGGPISSLRTKDGSGTLGGYIELQGPNGHWLPFALTCFHVIDPADEDVEESEDLEYIKKWRKEGIPFYQYKDSAKQCRILAQNVKVSHPSRRAREEQDERPLHALHKFKEDTLFQNQLMLHDQGVPQESSDRKKEAFRLKRANMDEAQANLNRTAAFFDQSKNVFGTVAAGSGYRRIQRYQEDGEKMPTELDWAIVTVKNHWSITNKLDAKTTLKFMVSDETVRDLATHGGYKYEVAYQGYRSGRRQGMYNGLRSAQIRPGSGEVKSLEWSICGIVKKSDESFEPFEPFALHGDSGSLIFLAEPPYEVLGMLFAGTDVDNFAYYTCVDDLQNDILKQTGGEKMRMYGA